MLIKTSIIRENPDKIEKKKNQGCEMGLVSAEKMYRKSTGI